MEKEKMQRIIGVMVIVAFVIIILPLIFGKSDIPLQAKTLTAPPFPDQPTMTLADNTSVQNEAKEIDITSNEIKDVTPVDATNDSAKMTSNDATKETTQDQSITPTAAVSKDPLVKAPGAGNLKSDTATKESTKPKGSAKIKSVALTKPHSKIKSKQFASQLKSPAWVIQMGSFKNKTNARMLADRLRAAGFNAFIREIDSVKGGNTRVYIGPEFKQAEMISLSNQIEEKFKLRGVVMSYYPLDI